LKYIIGILLVVFMFTSCNKKEIVIYNAQHKQKLKIQKNKIEYDNLSDIIKTNNKVVNNIAIVYSSNKIGKYAIKISDIVLAYSSNLNNNFEYSFFDIQDESKESINKIFDKMYDNKIKHVIFYLTTPALINLSKYNKLDQFTIYLPLINKNDSYLNLDDNIIFGGIDYKKQLNILIKEANSHIIEIYDNKYRNIKLHNMIGDNNITSYKLNGKYPNYKKFINEHELLNEASIILNLSVVKSSIFLSQLRASDDLNISQVLTTQNNYTPLLFVLSQKEDIKNLIIANSIKDINTKLYNINKLMSNDIKYDWVNYSTVLGLEYFKTNKKILFENIEIIDGQLNYPIDLFITNNNSFISYVKEQNATIIQENY